MDRVDPGSRFRVEIGGGGWVGTGDRGPGDVRRGT